MQMSKWIHALLVDVHLIAIEHVKRLSTVKTTKVLQKVRNGWPKMAMDRSTNGDDETQ